MTETKRKFIPEITINNKSTKEVVEINGVETEVEVPPVKGFNIKRRLDDGTFEESYLSDKLEAPILAARYTIKSKHGVKPFFVSNEFEYESDNGRNHVKVYAPGEGRVLFEGPYPDAKAFFDTGKVSEKGFPIKEFTSYTVLYLKVNGELCRFLWKMNLNNSWFKYKAFFFQDEFYSDITKFELEQKKVGDNSFWIVKPVKSTTEKPSEDVKKDVEEALNAIYKIKPHDDRPSAGVADTPEEEAIRVEEIPF